MGREERDSAGAQARIGGKLAVLGKPLREGTGAQGEAETLLDPVCHAPARLPSVVETEALQDHLEWSVLPLHNLRREDAVAVVAVPELDSLKFLVPLAFLGNAGAVAVDTALGIRTDEGLVRAGSRAG